MPDERIEVQRTIPATAEAVFAVLTDPQGHVDIDSSGMLQAATGEPVRAAGDRFVVHMTGSPWVTCRWAATTSR